nr:zinc finger protein 12-like [Megalopta genalis]
MPVHRTGNARKVRRFLGVSTIPTSTEPAIGTPSLSSPFVSGCWVQLPSRSAHVRNLTFVRQSDIGEYRRFYKPVRAACGQSNYRCPNCGRYYMRSSCLQRHLRVECGQAPKYQCNVCQNWFKYKYNLTAHLQLHLEEPKFQCDICLRRFYRHDKLVKHRTIAHRILCRA